MLLSRRTKTVKNELLALTALVTVWCGASHTAFAEIPAVSWETISDKDISPAGRAALSLKKDLWKHAETDHFVYHFMDEKASEAVWAHSETYYDWIKNLLGITEDAWKKKNHIFIFTDQKVWDEFKARAGASSAVRAYTNGWELFLFRDEFWLSPKQSLAHELTHVIIFRFLEGPLPLFLNEGFAQFVSMRAVEMQAEAGGYTSGPLSSIPEKEFIPLRELAGMRSYPEGRKETFYLESALLVRFLLSSYKSEKLYTLLRTTAQGVDFSQAVEEVYGMGLESLEEMFRASVITRR